VRIVLTAREWLLVSARLTAREWFKANARSTAREWFKANARSTAREWFKVSALLTAREWLAVIVQFRTVSGRLPFSDSVNMTSHLSGRVREPPIDSLPVLCRSWTPS